MNLAVVLVSASIHFLLWHKLGQATAWQARLPRLLAAWYQGWHCAYCFGFWAALVGHLITGMATLPGLVASLSQYGLAGTVAGYFFDALASAVLIFLLSELLRRIGTAKPSN